MSERGRLENIQDYNFTVRLFIYQGKSEEEITQWLYKWGASEEEINTIFFYVKQNFPGALRYQRSPFIRIAHFMIDLCLLLLFIIPICSITADSYDYLVVLGLPILYYTLLEKIYSQTLGKWIMGSMVVNKNGELPQLHRIMIRSIVRIALGGKLLIDADDDPRTLHDKFSGTIVVHKKRFKEFQQG